MKRLIVLLLLLIFLPSYSQVRFDLYERAINLYTRGHLSEAYKILEELKNDESFSIENRAQIHFLLGEIKFRQNEFFEANLEFENYRIKFPHDRNYDLALLRLGQINHKAGNYNVAKNYLQKFINELTFSKYYGLAYYWLGEVYMALNDIVAAERCYLEALNNSKTNSKIDHTLFSLGFVYEQKKLYDRAEIYYDKLLNEFPESQITPMALVRVAFTYYNLGNYQRAVQRLTDPKIKQLSNLDLAEAYYILANSYYKLGRFYDAQVEFQNVINRFPNSKMVRPSKYGLAWSFYQQNRFEQTHRILKDLSLGNDSLAERSSYWLGYISRNMSQNIQAIEEFKSYIEKYPDHIYSTHAKYQIGIIYFELKRFQVAESYLLSLLEDSTDDTIKSNSNIVLGAIALERKNFALAKTHYEIAISLLNENNNHYTLALLGLATANYYLNNFVVATSVLNRILTLKNPGEIDKVRFYLAECLFAQNKYSEAIKNYEQVIKTTQDDDLKELSLYGIIYSNFNRKDYSNVVKYAQQFLEKFTYSPLLNEVKLRLADAYYGLKNFKMAIEIYRSYFSDPEAKSSDYVSYQLAQALYRAGNLDGAIHELMELLRKYPFSKYADEVQYLIGWIKFKLGKYDSSIEDYQKVIVNHSMSPIIPLVYYSIGDAYFNQGKYDKAIENYNIVLRDYPNSDFVIDAINGIQYAYVSQGKIEEAADAITKFVYSNPNVKNLDRLLIKKGDLYLSQRRFQEAIASYREFISFFPTSSLVTIAYYSIAKAFIQLKSYDDALYNLSIVIRNYSGDELTDDAILETGNIFRLKGDLDAAIKSYQSLINNYSQSNLVAEANYWLAKSHLEQGEVAQAKIIFDKIIKTYQESGFYSRALFEIGKLEREVRPDSAINYFKKVVELRNDEFGAEGQYLIGEIYFRQKKYNDAISEFLKLRYAFAGHTDWLIKGFFKIAESYEALKNKVKAREFYNEVIKLDSSGQLGKEAKNRLRRLR